MSFLREASTHDVRNAATGGLSMETKPAGSSELKMKLCQLSSWLRTPAA
ncbi:hypothetical protein J6524_25485 [Bradyrhizobium sp. WSM 1738]|nr:hypothetical protein [Bradyrhizobium hereditatis]MCA6118202.1 hypothetical protein [Bradyrhizobium hereditatis]